MKILFVDDNRDVLNWGCRATSIALHEMLSGKFEISGTINKKTVDEQIPLAILPFWSNYFEKEEYKKYAKGLAGVLIKKSKVLSNLLGLRGFVVDENPIKSADRLLNLKNNLEELEEIYQKVKRSDTVVINGEGSMVFGTPTRQALLFQYMIIELANRLNKPAFYINTIFSDCTVTGRNDKLFSLSLKMLEKCRGVSLRDPISFDYLKNNTSMKGIAFIPDALFTWLDVLEKKELPTDTDIIIGHPETEDLLHNLDFSAPYICVSGSSLIPRLRDRKKALESYILLINRLKSIGIRIYLVVTCEADEFLHEVGERLAVTVIPVNTNIFVGGKILSNAKLFISGRYHPSILASLGGTPCIFLRSISHKTYSLQKVLRYEDCEEFPAFPSESDANAILQKAQKFLGDESSVRHSIKKEVQKLSIEAEKITDFISQRVNAEVLKKSAYHPF